MSSASELPVPIHRLDVVVHLGGALGFLLLVAVLSGSLLAIHFVPTPEGAHASVRHIDDGVAFGNVIRGVHVWSSHLAVVGLGLHALTVIATLGFRAPRRRTWVVGGALSALVFALLFTGRVLPQDAVAGTSVAVGRALLGSAVTGDRLASVVFGSDAESLLTRMHALHTVILPGLLVLGAAAHVVLVHRHGVSTPPFVAARGTRPLRAHLRREALVWVGSFNVVVALAVLAPVEAGPPLDPMHPIAVAIEPEWYFRPVYALLRATPPSVLGIPSDRAIPLALLLAAAALWTLPYWWRVSDRSHAGDRPDGGSGPAA